MSRIRCYQKKKNEKKMISHGIKRSTITKIFTIVDLFTFVTLFVLFGNFYNYICRETFCYWENIETPRLLLF